MTVSELLCLVERLEELHTKVQGVVVSLHLSMTLLYNVSRRWSTYLNRCGPVSSLEDVGAPWATVPFSLEPILLEI